MTTAKITNAQMLADVIVERYNVRPPVDIAHLVKKYAALKELSRDIPDVDALLVGLDTDEKQVFLNPTRQGPRRRFTLGHELGHILIGWHQAHELLCVTDSESDEDDLENYLRPPGADPKSQEIRAQEEEADAFAARVLVPKRFVDSISNLPVDEMLSALELADVSVPAGMRALAESLAPGYVFAMIDDQNLVAQTWHSGHGRTGVPRVSGVSRGEPVNKGLATRTLKEWGWAYHFGRRIWWGRADVDLHFPGNLTDWRLLFREMCVDISRGHYESEQALIRTMAGIGGALVNDIDEASRERVAGLLMIRIKRREDLDAFVAHPSFEAFVFARAQALYESVLHRGPRNVNAAAGV